MLVAQVLADPSGAGRPLTAVHQSPPRQLWIALSICRQVLEMCEMLGTCFITCNAPFRIFVYKTIIINPEWDTASY